MITICYLTCRENPRYNWFKQSLLNQYGNEVPIEILIVDGCDTRQGWLDLEGGFFNSNGISFSQTKPKWTPWQGEHKLPKDNWFAASNARNTGIIHAKGDYIVYVDDLSVLTPGWWSRVLKAYREKYIVLGSYKKVNDLVVENGVIKQYKESPSGNDSRLRMGSCWTTGNNLFGASFGAPIEQLLSVNGLDELCDGMGYEDTNLGARLQMKGYRMFYDTEMMTFECEECHSEGIPFRREDPLLTEGQYMDVRSRLGVTGWYQENGRRDCSHLLMDTIYTYTRPDNSWTWGNNFNLREIRETKNFPAIDPEMTHWATQIKLKDM